LKELPSYIGQLNAPQKLICEGVAIWRNYLHVLANWMHSKSLIWMGVPSWKNYLHLLVNWMHFKNLIWMGVATWKNTFIYWLVEWTLYALFGPWVSQLKITTFIYWAIECIPNLYW
jgi:hypothetical protein